MDRTPNDGLTVYGNIDVRLVNPAFDAQGRIAETVSVEGQVVKAGQVLAQLDTRRLELARGAAEAKAAAQRARLRELEAGTRAEEIRKLEAELAAVHTRAATSSAATGASVTWRRRTWPRPSSPRTPAPPPRPPRRTRGRWRPVWSWPAPARARR